MGLEESRALRQLKERRSSRPGTYIVANSSAHGTAVNRFMGGKQEYSGALLPESH